MQLSERLAEAVRLVREACVQCAAEIVKLPDNPNVQRLPGSGQAMVISSAIVFKRDRWDSFFHDWPAQYNYVAELLQRRRFSALRDLLAGHGYRDPSHGLRSFAPEVIERVKAITGDLSLAFDELDAGGVDRMVASRGVAAMPKTDAAGNLIERNEPRQLARNRFGP